MGALVYHGPGRKAWEEGAKPTLLVNGHQVDAGRFVTHRFGLDDFIDAYDVFGRAAETGALKVVLTRS